MKDFHCRDAGINCDYIARGQTSDEILEQARHHAEQAHQMKITPELADRVKSLIHDESSAEHRRSLQRRS